MFKRKLECLILLFLLGIAFASTRKKEPHKAYSVVFLNMKGKKVTLKPFLQNKRVVLLDFWATYCPPCLKEMPHFQKLYKKYHKKGFRVIGVNFMEATEEIKKFVKKLKITYPIWKARKAQTDALGIKALPTTMLFDREGHLVKRWNGYAEPAQVEKVIKKLLRKTHHSPLPR